MAKSMQQKREERKNKSVDSDSSRPNINWFPGHMAKTRRLIAERMPLIDMVAEVIDARIPISSRNPELDEWVKGKPRVILLNKCDMADDDITAQWVEHFKNDTTMAIPIDCKSGKGFDRFLPTVKRVLQPRLQALADRGMAGKTLRIMVVGIPNVGKSSFINRLTGSRRARVENRPGVTRGNQWYLIDKSVELMDTPGVLWPKFEDQRVGEYLAFCGSIKDSVLDTEQLSIRFIDSIRDRYFSLLAERFKISGQLCEAESYEILTEIAIRRGMKISKGDADTERAATTLLEEFRNCKIGKISLETPYKPEKK